MNVLPASWEFTQLQKDLARLPDATRRQLRRTFMQIGQPLLADAKRRAGWSAEIPDAITVRATTDALRGRVGVELRVSKAVPHARAYEDIEGHGKFRHPVFGRRDIPWVDVPTRPYAAPAVQAAADRIQPQITAAFEAAARECGIR